MTAPRLYLWNNGLARHWHPFAPTRPIGEMLFGTETLRARAERVLGIHAAGHLTGPELQGFAEAGAPPCLTPANLGSDGVRIVLSGCFAIDGALPAEGAAPVHDAKTPPPAQGGRRAGKGQREEQRNAARRLTAELQDRSEGVMLTWEGRLVGFGLPDGVEAPAWLPGTLGAPAPTSAHSAPHLRARKTGTGDEAGRPGVERWTGRALAGRLLATPWELMAANPERICSDGRHFSPQPPPPGVHRIGAEGVHLAAGARIEPGVVLDTTAGPILLGAGARVQGPARLTGPLWIGAEAVVIGGAVGRSSIGPACRVRGEVQGSILAGFVNKAHEGYLGHAVVGRWANLGALTTNSDLRHSLATGRIRSGNGSIDSIETGLLKLGCFLGDHVRTGIGTLLEGGAIVGAGSSIAGGGMAPQTIPPFSWLTGEGAATHEIERFLVTAERAMARRGVALPDSMRALFRRAHALSASERRDSHREAPSP